MKEERRDHKIYKYTNKVNGKVYVGRTCQTLRERAKHNGSDYKGCPYFWQAIQKYGWENFEPEILEEELTDLEAADRELFYIHLYDSTNHEKGYNICDSKDYSTYRTYRDETREKMTKVLTGRKLSEETKRKIGAFNKGKKLSEEHKRKIGESNKGKKVSDETRRKISEHHADVSGEKNPMWGKKRSPEILEKLRKAHLGKALPEKQRLELQNALKGREPWNKGKKMTEEQKLKYKGRKGGFTSVICVETGQLFLKITEAAASVNVRPSAIRSAIKKGHRSGGYHWHYADIQSGN